MIVAEEKKKSLEELAVIVEELKREGKTVAHCHGCFDLLHIGHVRHFAEAKRFGDILVVTITPDVLVNKGPGRPLFNQDLRAEFLASLEYVDYVAINKWPTAVNTLKLLQPDIYVKGSEYCDSAADPTGKITEEQEAVNAVGGKIMFTDDITFSSSRLINNHYPTFKPETEVWLKSFREKYSYSDIVSFFDQIKPLKVLVLGEAIIDEYLFCDGLGKSNKDPILAFKSDRLETYAGGSLAVANHVAGFCEEVGLLCVLGDKNRREDFIRENLKSNVSPCFVTQDNGSTIHKRRFVDNHTNSRLFETYLMDDRQDNSGNERAVITKTKEIIKQYDIVIIADYGHGMITKKVADVICKHKKYLAVNTQANAGNRGFNTISKYKKADYVCLAGHEVVLETRMRHEEIEALINDVEKRISCSHFTITQGKSGTIHHTIKEAFVRVPAFATHVSDRVGAGDAVLAITSLLRYVNAPWELTGFVGNLAGARIVQSIGNKKSIDRATMSNYAASLLKA